MIIRSKNYWALAILGLCSLVWVIPVLSLLVMSVRPELEIIKGWWRIDPLTITMDAWIGIWSKYEILPALSNSIIISTISTIFTLLGASAAAYAYQFLNFPGRKITLLMFVNLYVMPAHIVLVPLIQLYKVIGLSDTRLTVIIPFVAMSFSWSIYMIKSYLADFPMSLIDAAKIDGCGNTRMFWQIVLPNSITPIAAAGILQFMWTWNALMLPLIFLRTNRTLPVILALIQGTYEPNWDLVAVAAIVTTAIPLTLFLLMQSSFASGSGIRTGAKE